jgi:hypothetical protein
MHSCRRMAFGALVLGLAVVASTVTPAFAQGAQPPQSDAAMLGPPMPDPRRAPDPVVGDPQSVEALDPLPPIPDPESAPDASEADLRSAEALAPAPPPGRRPSSVAERMADWVIASGDNAARPFMIIDKLAAEVFAFDADGRRLGSAPALVGLAPGDDSAPGVGDLQLSAISPDERTTPAGRFEAKFGPSNGHGTVLWVDYADAISMHPVITTNPSEHRLQRIRSASPDDHRISFGCINVPAKFYDNVVLKAFAEGGIVYILPDTKPVEDVFPAFATAIDASAEESTSQSDRCADPPLDGPDRIPDSGPPLDCPAEGSQATDASPAP